MRLEARSSVLWELRSMGHRSILRSIEVRVRGTISRWLMRSHGKVEEEDVFSGGVFDLSCRGRGGG